LDANGDGKYQSGEQLLRQAEIKLNGKEIKANSKGELLAVDIGKGIHKVALDPRSIPITLTPQVDFINVKVEPGLTTEIFFPLRNQSASIEGRVIIKTTDGQNKSAGNIAIIISDSKGKKISYTYTDSNGYYILSDLPPGDYTVRIDPNDVSSRRLSVSNDVQHVNLPLNLDDFVTIKGINFEAKQTTFGL